MRQGVVSVDYYEDILSPTITAKIRVINTGDSIAPKDSQNPEKTDGAKQSIYNGLPLRGGERLVMTSKRFKKLPKKTNALKAEPINNLLSKVKENCTAKFDESLDLNILINNKQKKNEINLRSMVNLPSGTGKKVKVAVVCEETKISEAKVLVLTLLEQMILSTKLKMEI